MAFQVQQAQPATMRTKTALDITEALVSNEQLSKQRTSAGDRGGFWVQPLWAPHWTQLGANLQFGRGEVTNSDSDKPVYPGFKSLKWP